MAAGLEVNWNVLYKYCKPGVLLFQHYFNHVIITCCMLKIEFISPNFFTIHRYCSENNMRTILSIKVSNQGPRPAATWGFCLLLSRRGTALWWWWLMALIKISEVTRHLHSARSIPVHGIAMATGNSSLHLVSTVTDLLSFISVARETQPMLIDGILALPQKQGWEVGLPAIDFPTPPNTRISHPHTLTHITLTYPAAPAAPLF